jgi:hypothetical protein
MPRDYARRVAMGELSKAMGLAFDSNSDDVHKFAILLLARIGALAEGSDVAVMPPEDVPNFIALYHRVREKEPIQ